MNRQLLLLVVTGFGLLVLLPLAGSASVRVWEQAEVIPTYSAGEPEKTPMFYFDRASQGAEGRLNVAGDWADAHCLIGLGHLGLGDRERAQRAFDGALEVRPGHLDAKVAQDSL